MTIPFETLPSSGRIWIYQSSPALSADEKNHINMETEAFLAQWTAHGQKLQAAFKIVSDHFLIIGVNEHVTEASGCSIDRLVEFVRQQGAGLKRDFLNRSIIAYKQNRQIEFMDFKEFKARLSNGEIAEQTEIFDNSITTKGDLEQRWIVPVSASWLGKYIPKKLEL